MNKKFLTGTVVLALIGIIVLSGFSQTGLFFISPAEQKLNVGIVIPLTGAVGSTGQDFLNGLNLAKEKYPNANIELSIQDSQSNAKDGVSATKMLLDTQNIDALVSLQSAVVMPILAIAEQYKTPLIATAISKDEFTKSPYGFRLFPPAKDDAALAAQLANAQGIDKITIITSNDEYGLSMKENFKKNYKGTITGEESFEVSNHDFRTLLLKRSDTNAIFFIGYIQHYIDLFKQIKELDKNITVISNVVMLSNSVKIQTGNLMDNAFAVVPVSAIPNDKTFAFTKGYKEKYGSDPDWAAPFGYDMWLILNAIQKTNQSLIEGLYTIKIRGLNGEITFDKNRETHPQLIEVEVNKGNVKIISSN